MKKKSLYILLFILFQSFSVWAQINILPNNTGSDVNVVLGLQADVFDLKKGTFALQYENNNDAQVVTHSFNIGIRAEIGKEFKNTPLMLSFQYYISNLSGSFIGDNEVDLVKNPIEKVFSFVSPPRERNITSVKELALTLKTTLISTSLRQRTTPGIYLHLLSGIGWGQYGGEEIVSLDPPFQEKTDWKEQHTTLNIGGELVLSPSKKSDFFSLFLAVEKKHLSNSQRFDRSITALSYGFKISF